MAKRHAASVAAFLALLSCVVALAFALAGCAGSGNAFKSEDVTVGDCTVTFTGYRWDDPSEWDLVDGNSVFVLFGTVKNEGDSSVRPADHLIGLVTFETGQGFSETEMLEAVVRTSSEDGEVAAGESAAVMLWTVVDSSVKMGYYDGHEAVAEWGWSDENLSEINLDLDGYETFENIGQTYVIPLGRI